MFKKRDIFLFLLSFFLIVTALICIEIQHLRTENEVKDFVRMPFISDPDSLMWRNYFEKFLNNPCIPVLYDLDNGTQSRPIYWSPLPLKLFEIINFFAPDKYIFFYTTLILIGLLLLISFQARFDFLILTASITSSLIPIFCLRNLDHHPLQILLVVLTSSLILSSIRYKQKWTSIYAGISLALLAWAGMPLTCILLSFFTLVLLFFLLENKSSRNTFDLQEVAKVHISLLITFTLIVLNYYGVETRGVFIEQPSLYSLLLLSCFFIFIYFIFLKNFKSLFLLISCLGLMLASCLNGSLKIAMLNEGIQSMMMNINELSSIEFSQGHSRIVFLIFTSIFLIFFLRKEASEIGIFYSWILVLAIFLTCFQIRWYILLYSLYISGLILIKNYFSKISLACISIASMLYLNAILIHDHINHQVSVNFIKASFMENVANELLAFHPKIVLCSFDNALFFNNKKIKVIGSNYWENQEGVKKNLNLLFENKAGVRDLLIQERVSHIILTTEDIALFKLNKFLSKSPKQTLYYALLTNKEIPDYIKFQKTINFSMPGKVFKAFIYSVHLQN